MADTVDTRVLLNGPRNYIVHLTNISDSTGESAVVKIDLSSLALADGRTPAKLTIDEIQYSIQGFTSVRLHYDADTDDEIAILSGDGVKVFPGGLADPRSTGAVGDVLLTTAGAASGATYDITIVARKKN
jgi:hypothetical protein